MGFQGQPHGLNILINKLLYDVPSIDYPTIFWTEKLVRNVIEELFRNSWSTWKFNWGFSPWIKISPDYWFSLVNNSFPVNLRLRCQQLQKNLLITLLMIPRNHWSDIALDWWLFYIYLYWWQFYIPLIDDSSLFTLIDDSSIFPLIDVSFTFPLIDDSSIFTLIDNSLSAIIFFKEVW